MNKSLSILFVCLVLFASCTKIIEIELPETDIKPVVNCLFSDTIPFVVKLSFPKEQADTNNYYIENATVSITQQGTSPVVLPHIGKGIYRNESLVPERGIEYNLTVDIPGHIFISAKNRIPVTSTSVISIKTESGYRTEPVTGTGEEARIPVHNISTNIFEDKTVNDYMAVAVVYNYMGRSYTDYQDGVFEEISEYRLGYLNSNDPAIKNEGLESFDAHEILFFKDNLFTSYYETIRFNFEKEEEINFWVRFFQFSPEAFQYLKSWIIHDYTKEHDFWEVYEPQPLYSNIENGYGIFAGYSSQLFKIYPDSTITFE